MGSVPLIVAHVSGVGQNINAVDVIDVTVVVVVLVVPRRLAWVRPDIGREVGVGEINTGVDRRHHNVRAPGGLVPGGRGIDVVECPLRRPAWVVWRGE